MIPVKNHRGLYRDEFSNAIVNCNESEYNEYLKLKSIKMSEKDEIKNIKKELDDIKSLLIKLLDNKT